MKIKIKQGKNCIISPNIRFRYPELVELGDEVIIDDFVYISTKLKVGSYSHICTGVKIIGGKNSTVRIGDFCSLSPNVVVAAGGDSYESGFASCTIPQAYKGKVTTGRVEMVNNCFTGSNSVILPNVTYSEGSRVGALSLVKEGMSLEPYSIYAGVPVKFIKKVNEEEIKRLEAEFRRSLYDITESALFNR